MQLSLTSVEDRASGFTRCRLVRSEPEREVGLGIRYRARFVGREGGRRLLCSDVYGVPRYYGARFKYVNVNSSKILKAKTGPAIALGDFGAALQKVSAWFSMNRGGRRCAPLSFGLVWMGLRSPVFPSVSPLQKSSSEV
jgi:hypothetical protein